MRRADQARGASKIGGGLAVSILTLALAFFCLLFLPSAARAQKQDQKEKGKENAKSLPGQINISSDTMTHSGNSYYFEGSVVIVWGDLTAGGDRAIYNAVTDDLHLIGNAYMVDPAVVINAREAIYNMKSKTGVLYDASIFVRKRNFYIKGSTINRVAPDTYLVKKAVFTACEGNHPAWALEAATAKAVIGDKLWMKDARIKAGPIPVFYTPRFAASLSQKRASGFLSPNLGWSTFGGANIDIPYYWAISGNKDATVSLDYYSKRAVGGSLEGRYLFPSAIDPSGISGFEKLTYLRDWKDQVNYLTLYGWNTGPYASVELNWANHRDYHKLFDLNFQKSEQRFLESKGEGRLELSGYGKAFVRVRWFQDEMDGVDQSGVIQELPEAGVYLYPRRVSPQFLGHTAAFDMQSALTNFWREDGQTAVRFYAAPRLSYTVGDGVSFFQSAGVGIRHYDLMSPGQEIDRVVFNYDASLRTRFEKTFRNGVTHYVEPSLEFVDRDLSGQAPPIVFDSTELEDKARYLQASLMNRFRDKGGEFLDVLVTEQFDTRVGRAQPITLNISSSRPAAISGSLTYDPYARKLQAVQLNSTFSLLKGVSFNVIETYTPVQDSWVHNISSSVVLSSYFTVVNAIWYDTTAGLQQFSSELRYQSQCWGMDFIFDKKPGNTAFYARVRLRGLGSGV